MIELAGRSRMQRIYLHYLSISWTEREERRAQEESEFGLLVDFLKGNSVFFLSFLDQSPASLSSQKIAVGCRDSTFLLAPPGRIHFFFHNLPYFSPIFVSRFSLFLLSLLSSTCVVSIFSTHCLSLWH